jgi:hypothetical protein
MEIGRVIQHLDTFSPPGHLSDLAGLPGGPDSWSAFLEDRFTEAIANASRDLPANATLPFYNPTRVDPGPDVKTAVISWNGFPKLISSQHPGDVLGACRAAEQLQHRQDYGTFRPQDEYLEWHTVTERGKVVEVVFTCEGPEYWSVLADGYPAAQASQQRRQTGRDLVLGLYRKHVDPSVKLQDLLDQSGRYNLLNVWNTERGAMHLTQPNNYLSAEIEIAAAATVLRQRDGQVLTDEGDLIQCARYGQPGRSSDPRIGGDVNALARQGATITLQDPIGLYIQSFDPVGWETPNGTPAERYWTVLRGAPGAALRASYRVPASEGFAVGDIEIGGVPIQYGGQVALFVTMMLTGVASRFGSLKNPAQGCQAPPAQLVAPAGTHPRKRAG